MSLSKQAIRSILIRMKRANDQSIKADKYYGDNVENVYSISRATGDRQSEGMSLNGNKMTIYNAKCAKLDSIMKELATMLKANGATQDDWDVLVGEADCTLFWDYPLSELYYDNL